MYHYPNQITAPSAEAFKRWLRTINLLLFLVVVLVWSLLGERPAAAQSESPEWSTPVNLSNSPEGSIYPAIVADDFGYVHLFWTEDVGGESILDIPQKLIGGANTIFYRRWDGESWTQPLDILFVPGDPLAGYVAATVDVENRLHVVWTGQSNIYHSTAPSWKADSAHNWSKPVVISTESARSRWESDVAADLSGNVHILYATRGEEPGVYHTRSQDGGLTWGPPVKLSTRPFDRLELGFSHVRISTDPANRLHAVWQTYQKEGFGQAAYYSRSIDGGQRWSEPLQMGTRESEEYDVSYPYVAATSDNELHMVYIDGPWHTGRWHRISRDGGETWSEPRHIITDLEGVNGYVLLLTDGAGRLHLVATMRTITQIPGTFHAIWQGTEWSPVELAIRDKLENGPGAHWTAATVRLGNEIHVLWNTNGSNKAGEIWHSRYEIPGLSPQPALPVPEGETVSPTPTKAPPVPVPVTDPTVPTRAAVTARSAPVAAPEQRSVTRLAGFLPAPTAEVFPLLAGVVPALLMVSGAIVWTRARSR